jgi:hypothetical protein
MLFSTGQAWGMCRQTPRRKSSALQISVMYGQISLSKIRLAGVGELTLGHPRVLRAGQTALFTVSKQIRRRTPR